MAWWREDGWEDEGMENKQEKRGSRAACFSEVKGDSLA
jgi:hypothetical protein